MKRDRESKYNLKSLYKVSLYHKVASDICPFVT